MKIIDYFFRILTAFFFLILFLPNWFQDEEQYRQFIEQRNLKYVQKLPMLQETQDKLRQIASHLNASMVSVGGLKYDSSNHWIYSGAQIKLNQCIDDYQKIKDAIMASGFSKNHIYRTSHTQGEVQLYFRKASRYEEYYNDRFEKKESLCDILYFDYSWHGNQS